MKRNFPCLIAVMFCITAIVPDAGAMDPAAAEETEILKITVGTPTKLTPQRYQNTSAVTGSRTGVVAVFYPKPSRGIKKYRVSTDAGLTWGPEINAPANFHGAMSIGLRQGGVIKLTTETPPVEGKPGRYDAETFLGTDNFTNWKQFIAKIYMPDHMNSTDIKAPSTAKGPIIQLPNGDLLMPTQGGLTGDDPKRNRAYLLHSKDQGRNWRYYSSIDYTPKDPHPELAGAWIGSCEPTVALLPNGQMLAMLRTQGTEYPGAYKPLYASWSNDLGKNWTKPTPTKPHLMCISPTLQVLDNSVVACQYGRPGSHVAFSLDNGHTWQDRVSFSDLPEPIITGQFDMAKAGPNKLVVVGSDAEGTKVWPITVERLKVSSDNVALTGQLVAPHSGYPIADANVELGPNRYALDSWREDPRRLDHWNASARAIGSPVLGFRSIRKENGHSTVQTDAQGNFRFESVKLGEYVLTVEADGYAPQHRHIKVGPEAKPQEFRLNAGRKICNQVVDEKGRPVGGTCVVLNNEHMHADAQGFFHWSLEAPLPKQVSVKVYKRFGRGNETHEGGLTRVVRVSLDQHYAVPLSQIESQPLILHQ